LDEVHFGENQPPGCRDCKDPEIQRGKIQTQYSIAVSTFNRQKQKSHMRHYNREKNIMREKDVIIVQ